MEVLKRVERFFFAPKFDAYFRLLIVAVVIFSFFNILAATYVDLKIILLLDLSFLAVILLFALPRIGLYLIAFLFPFWGWELQVGSLNVPYVDVVGLLLFVAMALKSLIVYIEIKIYQRPEFDKEKNYFREFPALIFFVVFLLFSAFSIINDSSIFLAFKYLLRPIAFAYLVYVLLPVNLIHDKKLFKRLLFVMLISSVLVAVMGLASVFLATGSWFARRAVPMAVFGLNPLGGNQNAIAEALIIGIPVAMLLLSLSEKIKNRGWYFLSIILMIVTLLLTFSRSGWLVLLLQLSILIFSHYHKFIKKHISILGIVLLIAAVFIFYFFIWGQISEVQGSTSSRLLMTKIAYDAFLQSPLIGHGLNTFSGIVGSTFVYSVEFGDPLDSHGFIQKVLVESGIFGLISFIVLLGYLFSLLIKKYNQAINEHSRIVLLILIMIFAGAVFFQLFSTSYYLVKMWLPIGLCLAGSRLYIGQKETRN